MAATAQIWLLGSAPSTKARYFYSLKVGAFHRFCTTICSAAMRYSAKPPCAAERRE